MKQSKINLKNNCKIGIIKYNAVQARANYQIPLGLYKLISLLDKNSSIEKITYLVDITYHYFRVKKYYKKFPQLDKEYSGIIEEEYKNIFEEGS